MAQINSGPNITMNNECNYNILKLLSTGGTALSVTYPASCSRDFSTHAIRYIDAHYLLIHIIILPSQLNSIQPLLSLLSCAAFTTTFSSPILEVLHEWGSLYVLTKDNKFYRLDENDTQTKLETLFKKNLYPTAIK